MVPFVLFKHAAGYAIFRCQEVEDIGSLLLEVQEAVLDFALFGSVISLEAFVPFKTGANAWGFHPVGGWEGTSPQNVKASPPPPPPQTDAQLPRIQEFTAYYETTGLVAATLVYLSWNVFEGGSTRTNNHVEGWHNRLKKVVGKAHPNVLDGRDLQERTGLN